MTGNLETTEAENIEIRRRTSEVNSIINSASRLFNSVIDINEQIIDKNLLLKSYWLWGFGILGLVLHLFLREQNFELDVGSGMVILAMVIYAGTSLDINNLSKKLNDTNSKLFELERLWMSATDSNTFWEMKKYIEDLYGFDYELMSDEAFKWYLEQKDFIVKSVCGWEKAEKIAKYNNKIYAKMNHEPKYSIL